LSCFPACFDFIHREHFFEKISFSKGHGKILEFETDLIYNASGNRFGPRSFEKIGIIGAKSICSKDEPERVRVANKEDGKIMRNILIGVVIFLIVYVFLFLRRSKRETGAGRMNRCTEILGLKPGASQEEAAQAYRDLANVWHPDRFAGNPRLQKKAEEKIKEINAAYEYIKSLSVNKS
jgi:preprotein translocase subunit Sec63